MKFLLKFLISIGLIYFLLSFLDLNEITNNIKDINLLAIIIAFVISFLQMLILSYRWYLTLSLLGVNLNAYSLIKYYWSGLFFNQLMPSSFGGDVIKVILVSRNGFDYNKITSSVVIERLIGLLVFSLISIVTVIFSKHAIKIDHIYIIVFFIPILIIISLIIITRFSEIIKLIFPFKIINKLIDAFVKAISELTLKKIVFVKILLSTIISHFCMFLIIYIFFKMFIQSFEFSMVLFVMPVVFIISSLPISIAGWGLREASMVAGFLMFGISPEISSLVGIVFGLITTFFSIPGGFMWLSLKIKP